MQLMPKPRKHWHADWALNAPNRRAQHLPTGVWFGLTTLAHEPRFEHAEEERLWQWLGNANKARADWDKRCGEQYAALCRQAWAMLEYHQRMERERGPKSEPKTNESP
jgi:hypothetical protein